MSFSREQINKIARLARVKLTEEESTRLPKELTNIVNLAIQLQEIDTENVERLTSVCDMDLAMREDVITDGGIVEQLMVNAPKAKYNYFEVPKVIENE